MDYLKSNVDGAACGKLGPVGIGGVLRNHNGEVLYMRLEDKRRSNKLIGALC